MTAIPPRAIHPGDRAPAFTLPAVNRDGIVSLDDYRGKRPVLIGLFRGIHCPFCRRQLVQLGTTQPKLEAAGVDTLAIVNTPVERARLYYKYRPLRLLLASDPEVATHRAFGLPQFELIPGETVDESEWPRKLSMATIGAIRVNPTGELPTPLPALDAISELNRRDGFVPTAVDEQMIATHGTQLGGHFLIDPDGVVRWVQAEARDRPADVGKFPSEEDLLSAARALAR